MHTTLTKLANDIGDSDEEDESEVLEESPCGRYQKRREEVQQRDVPGIDSAYLAMDTEDGFEVVWNEVYISEKKKTKQTTTDKLKRVQILERVFDNLIHLEHPNLVKFHKYWTDLKSERRRMIFITEYMSSGSLKQFLKKTKKNNKTLKAWRRWSTQILSALSYLHSCDPPIIHGNLTTETIFIQHNGLIKIGTVAPDTIHLHVKTYKQEQRNMHFIAPEYSVISSATPMTTAVDIYSFGICALEMATIETLQSMGEPGPINSQSIKAAILSLDDPKQRDFIEKCLVLESKDRPTARELLFHSVLFEVHSLKLLTAHYIVSNGILMENDPILSKRKQNHVIATMKMKSQEQVVEFTSSQARTCDLEKLLEDVKNGIFPLTAFTPLPSLIGKRSTTPEIQELVKSNAPDLYDIEKRKLVYVSCIVHPTHAESKLDTPKERAKAAKHRKLEIIVIFDDKMKRNLTCKMNEDDSADSLADELISYGFIFEHDKDRLMEEIYDAVKVFNGPPPPPKLHQHIPTPIPPAPITVPAPAAQAKLLPPNISQIRTGLMGIQITTDQFRSLAATHKACTVTTDKGTVAGLLTNKKAAEQYVEATAIAAVAAAAKVKSAKQKVAKFSKKPYKTLNVNSKSPKQVSKSRIYTGGSPKRQKEVKQSVKVITSKPGGSAGRDRPNSENRNVVLMEPKKKPNRFRVQQVLSNYDKKTINVDINTMRKVNQDDVVCFRADAVAASSRQ